MTYLLYCGLFLPLIGFLALLIGAYQIGRRMTGILACSTVFIAFLCFSGLLFEYASHNMDPLRVELFQWIPIADIKANFILHLDPLSLLMALIITGVGFLIHVYSLGYMDHEEDFGRYFACMNLFIFSMLLLVLAGHLLLLFAGWEGVGLASYLLIGFWYTRPSAAQAATKAFIVNRIGDLGFLLGLLLTFYLFGTGDMIEISQRAPLEFAVGAPVISLLALLYFWGAIGKSAQMPLHVWLPDAMEGPTPVSALIHAATMVTAGVYLVVRMHAIFLLTPSILHLVGDVGAFTSLFAALCAMGQTDLKRVLAYSTISQLGLMFLACGVGAFYAAMFHLTTHAFVKALLFLSAGNVVHMMGGITNMEKMGGLSKKFYKTHWLFLIGALALSGVPPLSAFFSKDLILEEEFQMGFKKLYYMSLLITGLTAFYLIRAYCLTFKGTSRLEEKIFKTVKEAPSIMLTPVMILAFLSIFGGFLGFAIGKPPLLENFLDKVDSTLVGIPDGGFQFTTETALSIAAGLIGLLASIMLYTRRSDFVYQPLRILKKSFYIDEIYFQLLVIPLRAISRFITGFFEPQVIDGLVHTTVKLTESTAGHLQTIQSGQIRSYIAWMILGSVLLMLYFVF